MKNLLHAITFSALIALSLFCVDVLLHGEITKIDAAINLLAMFCIASGFVAGRTTGEKA